MKNKIISACALMLGALTLSSGVQAANIKTLEGLSNKTAYVIKRQGEKGSVYGFLYYQEGSDICQAKNSGISASTPETHWSVYYSEAEKGYFLYNLASGKFLSGNSKSQAVFTDEAVMVNPIYLETAGYWVLDCGGYVVGLEKADKGAVIFSDEVTKQNYKDVGFCFLIADTPNRELTAEEQATIEDKIKNGREAALQRYVDFVAKAEKMFEKAAEQKYAGAYSLDELKSMLENPSKYTLLQFEEAYNRAMTSRLPQNGYYRLHNQNRPGAYSSNLVAIKDNGQLVSVSMKNPGFGTAADGFIEDLNIFRVLPSDGDPWNVRLYASAPQQVVTCGTDNNSKVWTDADPSKATVFTFDPYNDYKRQMRLRFANADGSYITVSGSNELVAYNTVEASMQFWFEDVKEISVTTDANGYLSLVLPANITLPEGLKAWVVTSVRDGKAYLEETGEGIYAYVPFIIKGEPNKAYALPTHCPSGWYPSVMTGTCIKAEVGARQEIVSTPQGLTFVAKEAGTVNPGTAFVLTEDTTPLEVVMGRDPESGVQEIEAAPGLELFDLQGRLVSGTPRPGLYIDAVTRRVVRVK